MAVNTMNNMPSVYAVRAVETGWAVVAPDENPLVPAVRIIGVIEASGSAAASLLLATIAVFFLLQGLAALPRPWRGCHRRGHRPRPPPARVIKRFVSGLLRAVPMLASTIEDEAAESIALKNRVSIEIHHRVFQIDARLHHRRGAARRAGVLADRRRLGRPDIDIAN